MLNVSPAVSLPPTIRATVRGRMSITVATAHLRNSPSEIRPPRHPAVRTSPSNEQRRPAQKTKLSPMTRSMPLQNRGAEQY